jgi:hypothetical protein
VSAPVKAPYKNAGHAIADGLVVLLLATASVWPLRRRAKAKPEPRKQASPHGPDSPCAHNKPPVTIPPAPASRPVPKLTAAERRPGYCQLCGPECHCGGDAA